jgi:hypothetical protein
MGEDGRSFVASCKDVDKARNRLSGANKAQAVGEATEAKCKRVSRRQTTSGEGR